MKRTGGYERTGGTGLKDTMGSATGQVEHAPLAGGWSGTDDATSTAPSDQIGNPPIAEEEKPLHTIARDFDESIQSDEESQQQRAIDCDEASEIILLAEKQIKRKNLHRLAAEIRAARKE